jgi:hypothetical protein
MDQSTSRFDRLFTKQRPLWVKLIVSLTLVLLPFAAASLDGVLDEFLRLGQWRFFLLAPVIILYIWFISPIMSRGEAEIVRSIRPLVPMDDDDFSLMVDRESRLNPRHEWLAFIVGAILGLVSAQTAALTREPPGC